MFETNPIFDTVKAQAGVGEASHVGSFSQHNAAHKWLDLQLNGSTRVGLPWGRLLGRPLNKRLCGDTEALMQAPDHLEC